MTIGLTEHQKLLVKKTVEIQSNHLLNEIEKRFVSKLEFQKKSGKNDLKFMALGFGVLISIVIGIGFRALELIKLYWG